MITPEIFPEYVTKRPNWPGAETFLLSLYENFYNTWRYEASVANKKAHDFLVLQQLKEEDENKRKENVDKYVSILRKETEAKAAQNWETLLQTMAAFIALGVVTKEEVDHADKIFNLRNEIETYNKKGSK